MEYPSFYAIIPAMVRYSDLKPNAKLLYGEITSLTHYKGYCFATNKYFAKLYGVSKNTISLWIRDLNKKSFIDIKMIYKDKQIIERRIYPRGITEIDEGDIIKNDEDNKTRINIKKDIIFRKKEFESKVSLFDYDTKLKIEFCDYWTEQNQKGTKMRFEMQKTFDINLRLKRWINNNQKWNKKNQNSKIQNSISAHEKAMQIVKNMNINGKI